MDGRACGAQRSRLAALKTERELHFETGAKIPIARERRHHRLDAPINVADPYVEYSLSTAARHCGGYSSLRLTAHPRGRIQDFARRFLDGDSLPDRGASEMNRRPSRNRVHVVTRIKIHPDGCGWIDAG